MSSVGPSANAFQRLMGDRPIKQPVKKTDQCKRPESWGQYNHNYNPFLPPKDDRPKGYSPYLHGEPYYDGREAVVARFPPQHVLAPASKRERRQWVWRLGYALIDDSKPKKPTIWCCKLCHHDPIFAGTKPYHFDANTLRNAEDHLRTVHHLEEGGDIWRVKPVNTGETPSGIVDGSYEKAIPFRQLEFRNAFLEWMICEHVPQRKAASKKLKRCFAIANMQAVDALPSSANTAASWVHQLFDHFEPDIKEEIRTAKSKITITFDGWGNKHEKISVLGVVVHFINSKYEAVTRLIGLPELPKHSKTGEDQCAVLLPLLERFGINKDNLGYFVLDNASNNDTTLEELGEKWGFDPEEKRLRCLGHVMNLVAEAYLYGQDCRNWEKEYINAGAPRRRAMWRNLGPLGFLHNIVAHITGSGKRTELFNELQNTHNEGRVAGKVWKIVLDGGVRWNATYLMIKRCIELKSSILVYVAQQADAKDALDRELWEKDRLTDADWDSLELILKHLEPIFRATKGLEGNASLKEGARKASHGAMWEAMIIYEKLLKGFEVIVGQARRGEFDERVTQSVQCAWNKLDKYYTKTDASIATVATLVLHPRYKWSYFDRQWAGTPVLTRCLRDAKLNVKAHWRDEYKGRIDTHISEEPNVNTSEDTWLEEVLNEVAPPSDTVDIMPTSRKDEYEIYIAEAPTDRIGLMDYWKSRESIWPNLSKMAFDFLAIPAMSSECERIFSSCAKLTRKDSSRLSGQLLWHWECLANWQRRGAIKISRAYGAVPLDFGEDLLD